MEDKTNNENLIKVLCYLGIFVLLLFIVLPPLFRLIFPKEEQALEEPEKVVMNLNCTRLENFVGYQITTTIDTKYIDNKISNSIFTYEIEYIDSAMSEERIKIEEYEKMKRINNVDFNEKDTTFTISIDYLNFDYSNETFLLNHQKMLADQIRYYTEEARYECKTTKIQ